MPVMPQKPAGWRIERAGFQGCGVVPHAIKLVDGPGQVRYFDKLTMVLIL